MSSLSSLESTNTGSSPDQQETKRRRGRPKTKFVDPNVPKRPRGRPKTKIDEPEPTIKRGRGRPPKKLQEIEETVITSEVENDVIAESTDEIDPDSIKPYNPIEDSASAIITSEAPSKIEIGSDSSDLETEDLVDESEMEDNSGEAISTEFVTLDTKYEKINTPKKLIKTGKSKFKKRYIIHDIYKSKHYTYRTCVYCVDGSYYMVTFPIPITTSAKTLGNKTKFKDSLYIISNISEDYEYLVITLDPYMEQSVMV